MLSESSYLTAIYVYCGAAIMLLLCLAWWFGRRWPNAWLMACRCSVPVPG